MRRLLLLALATFGLLALPASGRAQQLDSLRIMIDDSVSAVIGRPVVAAFVLPDLSGSTAVDSARVQVKIAGGSWVDYYENYALVKLRKQTTWVLRGLPFDSLRFVTDTAQADTMWIHYVLR